MGTVLRPVYNNNTTLDSFRDAAQVYDDQLLTFYEAKATSLKGSVARWKRFVSTR